MSRIHNNGDQRAAAESLHVDSSGTFHTLDRYGNYLISKRDSKGGHSELSKVAYVGPGRPLGFTFDQSGNMIICDATIVSISKDTTRTASLLV